MSHPLPRPGFRPLERAWPVLVLAGLALNVMFAVWHFEEAATLAGCGAGSACETVLGSRWSRVFGVPVAIPGVLTYAALWVVLSRSGHRLLLPLLGVLLGAALWFGSVQLFILRAFCPWCLAAHGIGILIVLLGFPRAVRGGTIRPRRKLALAAAAAFLLIAVLQVAGPVAPGHRIESSLLETPASAGIHAAGEGRLAVFAAGAKSYRVPALPRLGPADAPRVMVEYFDYTCAACRTLSGFLDALLARHPRELALLVLPVPLEKGCNAHLPPGAASHAGACEISRLALAVWRTQPEKFPAFHRALLADPSPRTARRLALAHLTPERLETALADPWINALLAANAADWQEFSMSTDKLPKLLIRDSRILHGLPSGEADFIRVMELELGLGE